MTAPATTNNDDDNKLAVQLTIMILVAALMLNVMFYFLSGFYYDDKRATEGLMSTITDATVSRTRLSFGIFSALTATTLCGAMFAPKWVGHGVSALFGVASIVGAVFAARAGISNALTVSLVIIGLLYPALAVLSLLRQSRAAWSFLCAMCWVFGVVMLFGAPKVRSQADIGLWTAMIIPGMLVAAGVALTMARRDYRPHR